MKTVTIVGAGALGSHLVLLLRNLDAELRVIDFDRVEQKNVLAQFHSKTHLGKLKVQALQQTMQFIFGRKIEVRSSKLVDNNAETLLGESDLIIDCLDNYAARQVVQGYAQRTHTPCLHGGLAADGVFGRVVWDENFVIDAESGAGAATCEGGEHLAFIAMTAAHIALAAQKFITDGKRVGFQITPSGVIAT